MLTVSGIALVHVTDGGTSAAGEGLVDRGLEASHVLHWHVLPIAGLHVLVQDGKDLVVEDLEFTDSVHHLLQRLQGKREEVITWLHPPLMMFDYINRRNRRVSPTHHTLDDLVLAVVLLHLEQVVAEVQDVEAPLLSEEGDDHAAGPVEAVSEALPGKQQRRHVNEGTKATCTRMWCSVCARVCVLVLHSLHCELVGSHRYAVHKLHGAPQTVELHALVHVHHTVARQRPAPDGVIQEGPHSREDDLEHGQTAAEPLFGQ